MKNLILISFALFFFTNLEAQKNLKNQQVSKAVNKVGVKQEVARNFNYETFTDSRDNKTYKKIKIGNQVWMAENLAFIPMHRPSETTYTGVINDAPTYFVYKNDRDEYNKSKWDYEAMSEDINTIIQSVTYKKYGVLYNYHSAINACPVDWHLPSDGEWKELEKFLGMNDIDLNSIDDFSNHRNSGLVGKKLASQTGWKYYIGKNEQDETNMNLYNTVGFEAIPAGNVDNRYFNSLGIGTSFWTSTSNNGSGRNGHAIYREIYMKFGGVERRETYYENGFSVRCVSDKK